MWHKAREYSLDQLLEHPVLGLVMRSMGMDRQSVELLLEGAAEKPDHRPDPTDRLVDAQLVDA